MKNYVYSLSLLSILGYCQGSLAMTATLEDQKEETLVAADRVDSLALKEENQTKVTKSSNSKTRSVQEYLFIELMKEASEYKAENPDCVNIPSITVVAALVRTMPELIRQNPDFATLFSGKEPCGEALNQMLREKLKAAYNAPNFKPIIDKPIMKQGIAAYQLGKDRILLVDTDRTAWIYNHTSEQITKVHAPVVDAGVIDDNSYIIAKKDGFTINFTNSQSAKSIDYSGSILFVRALNNQHMLIATERGELRVTDNQGVTLFPLETCTEGKLNGLIVKNSTIVGWSSNGTITIWESRSPGCYHKIRTQDVPGTSEIRAVVLLDVLDGYNLLVAFHNGAMYLWKPSSFEGFLREGFLSRVEDAAACSFCRINDRIIAIGCSDSTIRFWDLQTGKQVDKTISYDQKQGEPIALSFKEGTLRVTLSTGITHDWFLEQYATFPQYLTHLASI